MQAYYDRFLEILGINTLPKRLHFIQPELIKRLPQHLPLGQVLWCSAAAMRKIRQHIKYCDKVILDIKGFFFKVWISLVYNKICCNCVFAILLFTFTQLLRSLTGQPL